MRDDGIVSTMAPESAGQTLNANKLSSQRPPLQCRSCLYDSQHPFGLTFDETGLCSGCITHAEKTSLDWNARFSMLERLVAPYRARKGNYDCVIPIRGTAEYFYVVDVVKNQLGLNPLLVAFNSQFNSTVGIQNLDLIRDTFDCDILLKTQSPQLYRKLMRETLSRFGSVHWPFLAGHTVWPVRVAVQHQIPLIIWPSHQPTEQVGMFSYLDENEMTRRSRHEHDLIGFEAKELANGESLLSDGNVLTSLYPTDCEINKVGVRGIYLSNYISWDRRSFSEFSVRSLGAQAAECPGTFDTYDHVDNLVYMSVHDLIKRRKLGYGKVRDHLCQEIRFGRISRLDAISIESKFSELVEKAGDCSNLNQIFFDWLGINAQAFRWIMDYHFGTACNKKNISSINNQASQCSFKKSYLKNRPNIENERVYILIGKGIHL
jgi:N-acetyl sugar amidotransferase